MKRPFLFFLAGLSVGSAAFAQSRTPTLCETEEKTVLACRTGKKIVSVCASNDLSPSSGYLQYRFGVPQKPPELVYPVAREHPKTSFRYGSDGAAKWSDD